VAVRTWTRIRRRGSFGSASTPKGEFRETVVLVFDSGNELVIHAMKARPTLLDLLP